MNALSNLINRLSPSATLAMSQRSAELKAQGVDVINLSVGEPDFNTPDHIKEAAKQAIDDNFSRYSPVPGYPALRNAIVSKLKNENNLDYTPAQISCANGAKQSVCNAIMVLVNEGDEVIVPAPFWVSYPEMVKLAEMLAKPFPFVRVDLYSINGKIYISEMTFTPAKGTLILDDDKCDFEMGEWLNISDFISK